MITEKHSATTIQNLIKHCLKINACAPLLKILLPQSPIAVNFYMVNVGDLQFEGHLYPSKTYKFFSYLGMSYLFADLHADNITLERYILHGRGYTDEAKFEFSAEQMEIIYKLAEIAN